MKSKTRIVIVEMVVVVRLWIYFEGKVNRTWWLILRWSGRVKESETLTPSFCLNKWMTFFNKGRRQRV